MNFASLSFRIHVNNNTQRANMKIMHKMNLKACDVEWALPTDSLAFLPRVSYHLL